MIYIKKLILVDESDNIIFKTERKKAVDGLAAAMKIVKDKGGIKAKLQQIDQEMKEYFGME